MALFVPSGVRPAQGVGDQTTFFNQVFLFSIGDSRSGVGSF